MSASDTSTCQSPSRNLCYFSIQPKQYSYKDETPSTTPFSPSSGTVMSDPTNPLLAYRSCLSSPTSEFSPKMASSSAQNLLQLQTQAAHVLPARRPQPQPLQNVLAVSDDSTDSNSSADSMSSFSVHSPLETARCSRCRRAQSIDMTTGNASDMISYGLNLFYCTRCANIVGFQRR